MTGDHIGHQISYVSQGMWSHPATVNEYGNIAVDWDKISIDDIDDTSLWCETCKGNVTGPDIGANDDWEAV